VFPDIYEGSVYRPPSEARSLILQATIGCSWNRCTFCSMFRKKDFRIRSFDEIASDVEKVLPYHQGMDRIFLADGNALCIPTADLIRILKMLYDRFEKLDRVTIYGGPRDILEKGPEDLRRLKEAGLSMIYLGLESGSAEVLKRIRKGATPEMMVRAARMTKEAWIPLSVIFILGLGGIELSDEHAIETARVLSDMDPEYAAALTLLLEEGTPITEEVRSGSLVLPSPEGILKELRTVVEGMEVSDCLFRANHASNYHPIGGRLPGDRARILVQIDLVSTTGAYRPESFRRL